jgi:alpha-L-arabinofuranosidase
MRKRYLKKVVWGALASFWVSFTIQQADAAQPNRPQVLNVHLSQRGARISSTLYGAFFEEINNAGEGGIYAELVRNRAFNESATGADGWSLVNPAIGNMALDASQPLNAAIPRSLKLTNSSATAGPSVGIANKGFSNGIVLDPGASYVVSLYAKANDGPRDVTVSLESGSGTVLARTTFTGITTFWQKFTSTLTVGGLASRTADNQLVVTTTRPGAVWLSFVSLFPPTWHGRPNGLRADVMNMVGAMHPKLMRFPGGNYIEGFDVTQRWEWKKTIGDVAQRPGHRGIWRGNFSSDGLGLHEYLQMCEDLGAMPVLGVYAGYSIGTGTTQSPNLTSLTQEALDAIEYAIGNTDTPMGAQRAANGHPAPFNLGYIEIGNEDNFPNASPSYNDVRFPAFYDAIKARYPSINVIATFNVTSRRPDVVDEHFYVDTPGMIDLSHRYDTYSRSRPKIFVGEYAEQIIVGKSPANLGGAIGEAVFMTGLERNADIVMGSAYAPLFANADAPRDWDPDLITFNGQGVYGSPNYYVQQMFSTHTGDIVIPTDTSNGDGSLFTAASLVERTNTVYLKVANSGSTAKAATIRLHGLLSIDPNAAVSVLTSASIADENSFAAPTRVAPANSVITGVAPTFGFTFPANSVTVFILTGVAAQAADTSIIPMATGERWSFQSVNNRDRYIRHRDFLGYVEPVNDASTENDASFRVVAGLDPSIDGCVSFASVNLPNFYLRHKAFRIRLDEDDGSELFHSDATFCLRGGLARQGVSFEAIKFPRHYIRHFNFELWVNQSDGGAVFNQDATFNVMFPKAPRVRPNMRHTFQSVNFPDRAIRHRNFEGFIDLVNDASPPLDKNDATFQVVPALSPTAPGCVSFAAVNAGLGNHYLRHANFHIRLDPNDGSPVFQADASFCPQEGLAGAGISFTPSNFPSRYLRHKNFALEVDVSDGSSQFHEDASFNVLAPYAP